MPIFFAIRPIANDIKHKVDQKEKICVFGIAGACRAPGGAQVRSSGSWFGHMRRRQAVGKIARGEWRNIVARYERGESIAQISRDYGCTAPAIRYIIKRSGKFHSRARSARAQPPTEAGLGAARPTAGRFSHEAAGQTRHAGPSQLGLVAGHGLRESKIYDLMRQDLFRLLVVFDQPYASEAQSLEALMQAAERLIVSAARVRLALERLFLR